MKLLNEFFGGLMRFFALKFEKPQEVTDFFHQRKIELPKGVYRAERVACVTLGIEDACHNYFVISGKSLGLPETYVFESEDIKIKKWGKND